MERRSVLRQVYAAAAAFSVQIYLALTFLVFFVGSLVLESSARFSYLWPWVFLATAILCVLSVLLPFSRYVSSAAGTAVALVGVARGLGVIELLVITEATPQTTLSRILGAGLWGLVVLVGLRWPVIAFDSGVKHLVDRSRSSAPPPPPVP